MANTPINPASGPPNLSGATASAILQAVQQVTSTNQALLAAIQVRQGGGGGAGLPPGGGGGGGAFPAAQPPPGMGGGPGMGGMGAGSQITFQILGNPLLQIGGNPTLNLTGNVTLAGGATMPGAAPAQPKPKSKDDDDIKDMAQQMFKAFSKSAQGMIPDTPGSGITKSFISGVTDIASSKNLWEGLLNTTKMILDVAVGMYMDSKRRTSEQIAAAGGSQQFARYYQNKGGFEAARHVQGLLETDTSFTPQERKQMPQVMGNIQRGAQGNFDLSGHDEAKSAMSKLAVVATDMGVNMSELGTAVGESARRTNRSVSEVVDSYAAASRAVDMYNEANKKEQISKQEFLEGMKQMTMSMKEFRFTEEDATAVTAKWAVAIDRGTVSIGEIIQQMKGFNTAEMGTLTYLATDIRKNIKAKASTEDEKNFAKLLDTQKNPVALAQLEKLAGQGSSELVAEAAKHGITLSNDAEARKRRAALLQGASNDAIRGKVDQQSGGQGELGMRLFMEEQLSKLYARGAGKNVEGKGFDVVRESVRGGYEVLDAKKKGPTFAAPGGAETQIDKKQVAKAVIDMEESLKQLRDKQIGWIDKQTTSHTVTRTSEVFENKGIGHGLGVLGVRALDRLNALTEGRIVKPGEIGPGEAHYLKSLKYDNKSGFGKSNETAQKQDAALAAGLQTLAVHVSGDETFKKLLPSMKSLLEGFLATDAKEQADDNFDKARQAKATGAVTSPIGNRP